MLLEELLLEIWLIRVSDRMFTRLGIEYDVIRQMGRWNGDVMMNAYITNLPWAAIRSLAGFPEAPGSFLLKRHLEPPNDLQFQIFPQIEHWEKQIEKNDLCNATKGHLKLLKFLRIVILQVYFFIVM
jgi:hypothetical protein